MFLQNNSHLYNTKIQMKGGAEETDETGLARLCRAPPGLDYARFMRGTHAKQESRPSHPTKHNL